MIAHTYTQMVIIIIHEKTCGQFADLGIVSLDLLCFVREAGMSTRRSVCLPVGYESLPSIGDDCHFAPSLNAIDPTLKTRYKGEREEKKKRQEENEKRKQSRLHTPPLPMIMPYPSFNVCRSLPQYMQ